MDCSDLSERLSCDTVRCRLGRVVHSNRMGETVPLARCSETSFAREELHSKGVIGMHS